MKGLPITQEEQQKMIELAKKGHSYRSIAESMGLSASTVSKKRVGYYKADQDKTYLIPDYIWKEWDRVTKSLRKYFKRSND